MYASATPARTSHSRAPTPSALRLRAFSLLVAVAGCGGEEDPGAAAASPPAAEVALEAELRALADSAVGEVAVYYEPLDGGAPVEVNADVRMHAASTMKVPVMIQLFRDRDAGRIDLDDPIPVTTEFTSIVDGSPYTLEGGPDSDTTLYARVGETVPLRQLVELMITRSSNLATNLLVERARADRVTATMRELGADSIEVLRGVQDIPAFEAGLSNTTTARDLGRILTALGRGEAASPTSTEEMIAVLERQEFRSQIPAGLPPETRVGNKTGSITGILHDAALVYPGEAQAYVLVVLTRGFEDTDAAREATVEVTRRVHRAHLAAAGIR